MAGNERNRGGKHDDGPHPLDGAGVVGVLPLNCVEQSDVDTMYDDAGDAAGGTVDGKQTMGTSP